MEKLNSLNVCSVLVLVMILVSASVRKLTKGKKNKYFLMLSGIVLLSALFDVVAVYLDVNIKGMIELKYFVNTGYFLTHNLVTPLYAAYLIYFTDLWHIIKYRVIYVIANIPFDIAFLLIMTNPWTKFAFYFDENGKYYRGKLMILLYLIAAFYMLVGTYFILKSQKATPRYQLVALSCIYPLTILAVLIQFIFPKIIIEIFINSLSLLFISTIIQRPEEIYDSETNAKNRHAYAEEVRRSFINKKSFDILIIRFINYIGVYEILSFEEKSNLLKSIYNIINSTCSPYDADADIYYLSNGDFCVSLKDDIKTTYKIARELNEKLKNNISVNRMDVNCVMNVCVVHCPEDIDNFDALDSFVCHINMKKDVAGNILTANDIVNDKNYDMLIDMEYIINKALSNHNLHVYYQPIYSIKDKKFKSAEALIRLIDDEYGFVPPDMFIPVAEKNGTIHEIGKYVLESVCQFIAGDEFKRLGLEYIEINLSAVQCMNRNLVDDIIEITKKYGVTPDKINLEITETAAAYEQKIMTENILRLSDNGFAFSLDDYGTGYSNMQRISSLPFKIAKLDKTFVNNDSAKLNTVIKNSVNMIKELGMEIVVEGIETKDMVDKFDNLGCDFIQGYYFSKPIPKDDFIKFITGNKANGK